MIFGSSITSTVIVVFLLNLFFNHTSLGPKGEDGLIETAIEHGAVSPEADDVEGALEASR